MSEVADSSRADADPILPVGQALVAESPTRQRPWWFWVVALGVGVTGLLWVRMAVDSHAACKQAQARSAAQDTDGEIMALRHAIESWAPAGTCATAAADRLTAIADGAEAAGDVDTALFALRTQRTALMSIRHLWVPQGYRLEQLHPRIGRLMALQVGGSPDVQQAHAARYTQQLDGWRERGPRMPLAFLASIVFAAWLVTLVTAAQRGFHEDGSVRRTVWPWAIGNLALLVSWLTLVRLA
jgi:hypothetical protein